MPSVYSTLKYEENAILWGSLFLTIIKNKNASTATSRLHNRLSFKKLTAIVDVITKNSHSLDHILERKFQL